MSYSARLPQRCIKTGIGKKTIFRELMAKVALLMLQYFMDVVREGHYV